MATPNPHVDKVLPLMAEGRILSYLDIPFQPANANVLKAMRRPAHSEKTLDRIRRWREDCPDLTIRSTFIVGFPGETEEDFELLLDWLDEAQIDRGSVFEYEAVEGAEANTLPGDVDEDEKTDRWERIMALQREISEQRLATKVGRAMDVIIDELDSESAIGRTRYDAPDVDGSVFLDGDFDVESSDIVTARIIEADEFDLWADGIR